MWFRRSKSVSSFRLRLQGFSVEPVDAAHKDSHTSRISALMLSSSALKAEKVSLGPGKGTCRSRSILMLVIVNPKRFWSLQLSYCQYASGVAMKRQTSEPPEVAQGSEQRPNALPRQGLGPAEPERSCLTWSKGSEWWAEAASETNPQKEPPQ